MKTWINHVVTATLLLACWQTTASAQHNGFTAGQPHTAVRTPQAFVQSHAGFAHGDTGAVQPAEYEQPLNVVAPQNTMQPGGYFEPTPPDVMIRPVAPGSGPQSQVHVEAGEVLIEDATGPVASPQSDLIFPTLRIFEPKARVYFDTGWESASKLDIFHDGSLSPSINFIEVLWQHEFPILFDRYPLGAPEWRWGPKIGIGLSSQADDSLDGTRKASGAPVMLLSLGIQMDFPLTARDGGKRPQSIGVEFGYAVGFSADETLDYSADGAIYVGVSAHLFP